MTSLLDGEIAEIINDELGDIFLDATLTRDGANSGDAYDPTTAEPTEYTCKAIVQDYSAGTNGLDLVGATDVNVLILANSLSVEPKPLDRIDIASKGISGTIYGGTTGLKAVRGDPATATWQCRVVT